MRCQDCGISIPTRAKKCKWCVIASYGVKQDKKPKPKYKVNRYSKTNTIVCEMCGDVVKRARATKFCSVECNQTFHKRKNSKKQKILDRLERLRNEV